MQVLIVLVVLLHVSRIHGIPQILFESDSNESRNVNSGTSNLGGDKIPNPGSSDGKSGNGDSLRALCPTLAEHLFPYYRHDRVSGKCYRGGDRGPCGKNMIFYSEENSHGACDCDYRNQDRELVFHADSSQCHFVYSQGYCPEKKWLIFNEPGQPTCAMNPCHRLQGSNRTVEFVPFKGKCLPLGSECGDGKVVGFVRGKLLPTCTVGRTNNGFTTLSVTVPKLRCTQGSVMSITGKCRPAYKLNLS